MFFYQLKNNIDCPKLSKIIDRLFTFQGLEKKRKKQNMERCRDIFQEKGYKLIVYSKDNYSFYHCLYMTVLDNKQDVTPKKAIQKQNDLFEFEKKNPMYYHLFLPQCIECDGKLPPKDCLSADLKIIQKGKKNPTPREIFAAAEMLQRNICVIRFDHAVGTDIERLTGYMFAPTNKQLLDMEPLYLLMMEQYGGCTIFGRFCRVDDMTNLKSYPGDIANLNHSQCFGLRFVNDFSILFSYSVAFGEKPDVKDLFRRLSLEFYRTEEHHERILNIICNFELEEDNFELFCKYADNTITEETSVGVKKRILKTHIVAVQRRLKPPGEGELFALSSVFNVDLIIDTTGRDEWETYMSVVGCYLSCFDSPILLRSQSTNSVYMPYVTEPHTCSCRQQKPKIPGHIGKIKSNINEIVCMYSYVAKQFLRNIFEAN